MTNQTNSSYIIFNAHALVARCYSNALRHHDNITCSYVLLSTRVSHFMLVRTFCAARWFVAYLIASVRCFRFVLVRTICESQNNFIAIRFYTNRFYHFHLYLHMFPAGKKNASRKTSTGNCKFYLLISYYG